MIKMIWCEDLDHGIGKNNQIPWKLKQDLLFFKEQTINNIVVMGKKTWESLPFKPLKNRDNYVLTRDHNYQLNQLNTHVIYNYLEILELNKHTDKTIFIIGGKQIFELFFAYADQLIISKINKSYNCDVILKYNLDKFKLIKTEDKIDFIVNYYQRI